MDDWERYNIQDTAYDPLTVTKTGPKEWTLAKPSVFRWTWDKGEAGILVPQGYAANASVPRFLESLADPEMLFDGSVPHDFLYERQGGSRHEVLNWRVNKPVQWSRARCDAIAFAFWLCSGVPVATAELAYAAVHLCGGTAWRDGV